MARFFVCLSLLLLNCFIFCSVSQETVQPGSSASHHLPIESHHSLHHPFDVSLPYWKYGGATVCTESFIRLTPNTQSRSGWVFNEFELQSSDWEIELHVEVFSDYHIGGDGFGLWILNSTHHPRKAKHHNYLAGPVFGMKSDFQGFGVIFDTYDNDGQRDNPLIAVIKQNKGDKTKWDHDNDFQENMIKSSPNGLEYECNSDYRNSGVFRVIARYIDQTLHIYTAKGGKNAHDAPNYQFCLSVRVGIDSKDMFIAMSAMTGEVADRHDIFMLSTRYLDSADANKIDDTKLKSLGYRGKSVSWTHVLFWFLIVMINGYLVFEAIYEFYMFDKMKSEQKNPSLICEALNPQITVSYVLHFAMMLILILIGYWRFVFVNAPIIGWKAYQFMTDNWKLESVKLRKMRGWMDIGHPAGTAIKTVFLVISAILAIVKMFT